jgi:hypothetical protein
LISQANTHSVHIRCIIIIHNSKATFFAKGLLYTVEGFEPLSSAPESDAMTYLHTYGHWRYYVCTECLALAFCTYSSPF